MREKRSYPRGVCLQSCIWSILGSSASHSSRIINQSPCGMLLETDEALPAGLPVKVVRTGGLGLSAYSEAAYILGIVRWSALQPGGIGAHHDVGIEITRVVGNFDGPS